MGKNSERALNFAIRAHAGQYRRCEPDKPSVLHPIIVGELLKFYGFDDNVVAAGYLHDVVEDTDYTLEDISRFFGGDISSLVATATEPDRNQPWEVRKRHSVKIAKDLPERNKAILCADKIANLEDFIIYFGKIGYKDFSKFHSGVDNQQLYYQGMYDSLVNDWDHPMLDRLYNDIIRLFYSDDLELKDNASIYNRRLFSYRDDLIHLRNIIGKRKPYIIEFAGTKKENDSMIHLISDFFSNSGFKVKVFDNEKSESRYQQEHIVDKKSLSEVEKNLVIASAITNDLLGEIVGDQDVIIINKGLFDLLILIQTLINQNAVTEDDFNTLLNFYLPEIESLVDHVVVNINHTNKKINEDYLGTAIDQCTALVNGMGTSVDEVDLDSRTATLTLADTLLPVMSKEYVLRFKNIISNIKQ